MRTQQGRLVVHHTFTLLLGVLAIVGALHAQGRPISVATGGGLVFADHGPSSNLGTGGITVYVRVGRRSEPLRLDVAVQTVLRKTDIVFGPCPSPPAACGPTFTGPSTALTVAPAIQATQRVPSAAWLFRFGPSVSWLAEREPGSDPLAAGLRVGISVRNGRADSGLLLSADFFRLFRTTPPTWFLPLTIGWQF